MTTPEALPMLRPFAEAVAFQRQRTPMTREQFDLLEGAAKMRGFTIAGMTKRSCLESAYREATRAIEEGLDRDEFIERLGDILDQNGGTFLSPERLELIAQNNLATAYSAGRFEQMSDPDVVAERPYWQYPLGPSDARTSEICKKLEGFVARHDDPVWQHVFPPNHHKERHLAVLTLTEEQARARGIYESPTAGEYPQIDGQTILPDPGWDYRPGLLEADQRALDAAAGAAGDILPGRSALDRGLARLEDIATDTLPASPELLATSAGWPQYAAALGIEGESTLLVDALGDGIRAGRPLFDALAADGITRLAPVVRATVADPFEVWMVERLRADGERILTKRYVGLYRDLAVTIDEEPGGWIGRLNLWASSRKWDLGALEAWRAGRLLLTKAGGRS